MSRGLGVVDWLRVVRGEPLVTAAGLLTQLGDVWFLCLLLGVLFWRLETERRPVALVAGLFVVGLVLTQALKHAFGLPRPGGPPDPATVSSVVRPLYEATALADGPGFPSGHAVGTAVVYGGLAATVSVGTTRRRYAAAVALVGLVSLTRVVLAHHYLVDVAAGTALGAAVVAGGLRARRMAQ